MTAKVTVTHDVSSSLTHAAVCIVYVCCMYSCYLVPEHVVCRYFSAVDHHYYRCTMHMLPLLPTSISSVVVVVVTSVVVTGIVIGVVVDGSTGTPLPCLGKMTVHCN
jgi:hypothetical protein